MIVWLPLLFLLLPGVSPCLQCDQVVRNLNEDFLSSITTTVADQVELKKIIDYAYVTYETTSQDYHGVTDPTTLFRARTEYQNEFKKFQETVNRELLMFETIQMMEKGRTILEKHLVIFAETGYCPNKCGLLNQRVMNCLSCRYEFITCQSPPENRDCGVQHLEGMEKSQVVLDCFFPWHTLVVDGRQYQYSWTSDLAYRFTVFLTTSESRVVLNQLIPDDQGVFQCLLMDNNNTVLSSIMYLLTVKSAPIINITVPTLPTLPSDESLRVLSVDFVIALVATLTALCFTGSLIVAVFLSLAVKRQQKKTSERMTEEVEMSDLRKLTER